MSKESYKRDLKNKPSISTETYKGDQQCQKRNKKET